MKDSELQIDRSCHVLYSKPCKKEILAKIALHYPEAERETVWEKVQRQYAVFLSDWRTDLGGKKNFHNGVGGTYDCIAIMSYYVVCKAVTSFREIEEMEENLILPTFRKLKFVDCNKPIDLLKSKDLKNWTSVTFDFRKGMQNFCDAATATSPYKDWSTINRVWAPQIFWDPDYRWENGEKGGYMIYYSMLNRAEEKYDRMYYSYADKTFRKLTTPKLLFDWGYATIDADINFLKSDGLYHMLIKKEGGKRGIFTATSKYLTHGWGAPVNDDFVSFEGSKLTEGSSAFQLIGDDTWRVAYIQYSDHPKHYRICKADKYLRNFSDPVDIKGVTAPQHGSFMRITKKEYKMLQKWDKELKNKAK